MPNIIAIITLFVDLFLQGNCVGNWHAYHNHNELVYFVWTVLILNVIIEYFMVIPELIASYTTLDHIILFVFVLLCTFAKHKIK